MKMESIDFSKKRTIRILWIEYNSHVKFNWIDIILHGKPYYFPFSENHSNVLSHK